MMFKVLHTISAQPNSFHENDIVDGVLLGDVRRLLKLGAIEPHGPQEPASPTDDATSECEQWAEIAASQQEEIAELKGKLELAEAEASDLREQLVAAPTGKK